MLRLPLGDVLDITLGHGSQAVWLFRSHDLYSPVEIVGRLGGFRSVERLIGFVRWVPGSYQELLPMSIHISLVGTFIMTYACCKARAKNQSHRRRHGQC